MDKISEILDEEDETDESRCLEYMATENALHDMDRDPERVSCCLDRKTSQAMFISIRISVVMNQ